MVTVTVTAFGAEILNKEFPDLSDPYKVDDSYTDSLYSILEIFGGNLNPHRLNPFNGLQPAKDALLEVKTYRIISGRDRRGEEICEDIEATRYSHHSHDHYGFIRFFNGREIVAEVYVDKLTMVRLLPEPRDSGGS